MRLLVFTVRMGTTTDVVRPPLVVDPKVRYLCFSDTAVAPPYEWIPIDPSATPMLAARRIKILSDHPALTGADATCYHDASYQLTDTLAWARRWIRAADVLALNHPNRTQIEQEALAIARYGYLTPAAAQAHVSRYRAAGFVHNELSCTGLVVRRRSPAVAIFNRWWWAEAQQWGGRDQGSFNYALWATGMRLWPLPGTIRENAFARWRTAPAGVA
jgi:hypothetical protein